MLEHLKEASRLVGEAIKGMPGTERAAGDFGRGAGGDVSRRIDMVAEEAVLDYLRGSGVECTVLGEECGRIQIGDDPRGFVIMDAIDGSANAVRGLPFFCCSLAFAEDNRLSTITDGVVADLSAGDTYWASKGRGAFCNGSPMQVHRGGLPYRIVGINTSGAGPELMGRLQHVYGNHNHTRHLGANALEMALLAAGLMDVFIDFRGKIRIQDAAAGCLLVREAGGIVLDENLKELDSALDYSVRLSFAAASDRAVLDTVLTGDGSSPWTGLG
ncbi:archaeal fructose-1,6-bisphosphatase [Cenarchaeum symbiosum A]|uniref:Archaeal fructose-1,6-bisphosphatase n=1 Tax=Cenarchaeum symbiosum (strain A) TaxID=414004 RepID=A0RY53_CENSY|nr:archaeal fructose-1,6-bisphosphatase [Cenarchaeum symbiosum A]